MITTFLLVSHEAEVGGLVLLRPVKDGEPLKLHHFGERKYVWTTLEFIQAFPVIFGDDPEKIPRVDALYDDQAAFDLLQGTLMQLVCVVWVDQATASRIQAAGYDLEVYDLGGVYFPRDGLLRAAVLALFAALDVAGDVDDEEDDEASEEMDGGDDGLIN